MSARIAVLASGNGSNLQAILDACADGRVDASVVAVVSDRVDARALDRGREAGVSLVTAHPWVRGESVSRRSWDASLAELLATAKP